PALLSVTADSTNRVYGDANPVFTGVLEGLVNGDVITATYASAATNSTPPGAYGTNDVLAIIPGLLDSNGKLGNYSLVVSNGTISIAPAPLTVSVDGQSRVYGTMNQPLVATVSGLKNDDAITAMVTTVANAATPVGSYGINVAFNDPDQKLAYYTVSTNVGSLTIEPAPLTVTAGNAMIYAGQPNPAFSATITGFVNADDASVVTGQPAFSTTATPQSPAGTYPIVPSIGTLLSANYVFVNFVDGILGLAGPDISIQPVSQTVQAGQSVTFSVVPGGTGPFSYQWYYNNAAILKATNSTYVRANVQQSVAGAYGVVVTTPFGSVRANIATLTVVDIAPIILTQPASRTVGAGKTATFAVNATGSDVLAYQWKFEGNDLAGATSKTLNVLNAQSSNSGHYSVVITNDFGTVTSTVVNLTVTNTPPAIVTQPISRSLNAGATATFVVSATGSDPKTYQWKLNGADIAGANAITYIRNNVQGSDAGAYTVVVANSYGSATSANATLTVNDVVPTITSQPVKQTVAQGSHVSFSVSATGTTPFTYQWRLNGTNILGETASILDIPDAQAIHAGNYSVIVGNSVGSVVSGNALLTVNVPAAIVVQPVASEVKAGSSATFTVTAVGSPALRYQWLFNGTNITGATRSNYTRANVQQATIGIYSVIVTNTFGSVTSQEAELSVIDPVILTQPSTISTNAGSTVTFRVTMAGTKPFAYQWQFNGSDLPGATNSTFTRSSVQQNVAGQYAVTVTNAYGTITSDLAVLTVNDIAPVITTQPVSVTADAGKTVSFSVKATGTTPFTYQWYFEGSPLLNATNTSYSRANIQQPVTGSYYVMVANPIGSTASSNAVLTVTDIAPVITTQPLSKTNFASATATFTVRATGTLPIGYQWYKDGAEIVGATSSNYTRANLQAADQGNYTAVVTNYVGSATSQIAQLVVDSRYVPVTGAYNGLFYETTGVNHESSGFVSMTANQSGTYSGKVMIDGGTYTWNGQLDLTGAAMKVITRSNATSLNVTLQINLDSGSDQVTGHVTDGIWDAPLIADRDVFTATNNPATNYAGRYTLVIPGSADSTNAPGGNGYGLVNVDNDGLVTFTGALADGVALAQNVSISANGDWPLYVGTYGGKGSVLGWLKLTNSPARTVIGTVSWIKQASPGDAYYANGFTNQVSIMGSGYDVPSLGNAALTFTNGFLIAEAGNLGLSLTNAVTLKTNSTVTVAAPNINKWKITLTPTTGFMTGTFIDSAASRTNTYKGVLLQNTNIGLGYFLGSDQSGAVYFGE
ncbi:MAG: Xanthan lyase, partial [Verrucomicrobiales bacterium]|nr:Xanthan lyase [Verrucomicrobiales bacterium]